jgi:hypothetical protein
VVWINAGLLSACSSFFSGDKKAKVFGADMPSMKSIHDAKFHQTSNDVLDKPSRLLSVDTAEEQEHFHWLPNPTLTMYVFKHLTAAGHPVPGYSTFFRLYTQHHIADPSEQGGWE